MGPVEGGSHTEGRAAAGQTTRGGGGGWAGYRPHQVMNAGTGFLYVQQVTSSLDLHYQRLQSKCFAHWSEACDALCVHTNKNEEPGYNFCQLSQVKVAINREKTR